MEIHAWEQDEGVDLLDWERRAVMAIDAAWVEATSERMEKDRKAGQAKAAKPARKG